MSLVLLETAGAVATITLDRPQAYNAFDKTMRSELLQALTTVETDPTLRVCIIKGAGRGFSAGNDLGDFDYDPISDLIVGEYLPLIEAIQNSQKLFIAQLHGSCAGIATAIAMNCDFITMADDSSLYLAFAAIGIVPDGGCSFQLMNAMGYHRALEAIVEGRRITADECRESGIANRVFSAGVLESETRAWAEQLACTAPLANAAAKKLLRGMVGRPLTDTLKAEAEEQNALVKSNDFKRGVSAFQKRTTPYFRGD
ncbi:MULTISPECIES: enoyl-CoA hydratase/isomerase family protein [unclassified Halomonas]|uniref:enoyl-CoA hydratase/isomerase family protein n=1 Tax=Halomonas sp. N3-2A TaxID=2014541 RepID=UPI000B5B1411|nr:MULTISPECIES: enoyl-CoA hydratase/isomerase family protein [unclassified Halomonas]ASK21647.1 enoyl-CoA hydratase [Halomonas sp. N3-2A]UTD56366.1 enoyl-CoA hydratase/isomerase family protein [Halomonas sp. MS1]